MRHSDKMTRFRDAECATRCAFALLRVACARTVRTIHRLYCSFLTLGPVTYFVWQGQAVGTRLEIVFNTRSNATQQQNRGIPDLLKPCPRSRCSIP